MPLRASVGSVLPAAGYDVDELTGGTTPLDDLDGQDEQDLPGEALGDEDAGGLDPPGDFNDQGMQDARLNDLGDDVERGTADDDDPGADDGGDDDAGG